MLGVSLPAAPDVAIIGTGRGDPAAAERRPTYRLLLLGGFAVEGDGARRAIHLSQRRAEALLAILALSGDLGCSRDRVIALLWSERDAGRARHNLRDVLHAIRRALGRDAVLGAGDALRLDPASVTSDVQQFAEALRAGRAGEAVALYHGPLLDGFHLASAPEFERWVDDERGQLFRECLEATKGLAKAAEQEQRWDAAAECWARAVALDPYNSRLVVRRIVALARGGDRANAIKEGETHIELLRADLELEPDPSFLEELQRIRTGGLGPIRYFTPPTGGGGD